MNWQQNITKLKPEPRPMPKPALATASAPVPFVDATANQCRYPLWDDSTPVEERMVCGAPTTDGASWCAGHCEAVFALDQRPDRQRAALNARANGASPAVKVAA